MYVVSDPGHHSEIVGDPDYRHAEPFLQAADQFQDLCLDRHVERRRRLVGDQQLGLAGQRHGDHHALTHAAREFVRVLPEAALRRRDVHEIEKFHRPRRRLTVRHPEVLFDALGQLAADRQNRIERCHWVLKYEADFSAADAPYLLGTERQQVAALEQHLAPDDAARRHGNETQHRKDVHALAAAAFAHDAKRLALAEGVRHVGHRMDDAAFDVELDRQITNLENIRHREQPSDLQIPIVGGGQELAAVVCD